MTGNVRTVDTDVVVFAIAVMLELRDQFELYLRFGTATTSAI